MQIRRCRIMCGDLILLLANPASLATHFSHPSPRSNGALYHFYSYVCTGKVKVPEVYLILPSGLISPNGLAVLPR